MLFVDTYVHTAVCTNTDTAQSGGAGGVAGMGRGGPPVTPSPTPDGPHLWILSRRSRTSLGRANLDPSLSTN